MEKKFYKLPEAKVVEIDVENILTPNSPDNVLPGGEVPGGGKGNDEEGDAKGMLDDWED